MNIKIIHGHLLLSMLFLLFEANGFAQPQLSEYYPIGTTWEEVYTEMMYNPGDPFDGTFVRIKYSVDCDTIIDDKSFKIVSETTIENIGQPSEVGNVKKYLLREQGDSIFFCEKLGSARQTLIYNFNWKEEDSLLISVGNRIPKEYLTHSHETLLDGNSYECFSFSPPVFLGRTKYIYKSIGQTIGGVIVGTADLTRATKRKRLTKFTRNNVLIYENEFPSPVTEVKYQDYYPIISAGAIYDLTGRKLQQVQKKGVYIQDGRKFVVR